MNDPIQKAIDDHIAMERDAERYRKWRATTVQRDRVPPHKIDDWLDNMPMPEGEQDAG